MKRWIPIILLALTLASIPVLAQAGLHIEVDPGDTPLVITGWLGEENAFVGNLRLTARGGDVAAFTFLTTDLAREEGDEVIGRQQISLVGDPTLSADVPKNFQVTVSGPPLPGTYRGQIEILLPGQAQAEALVIPLTVVAKARPTLTPLPGTDRLQLRLVRCGPGLDCALARLLLPDSAFLDSWQLQFDNPVQAAVTVVNAKAVVIGEQTGYQLTDAELVLPADQQTLPAGQVGTLPLTLYRSAMPPDHYTGAVYLTLDGKQERVALPVDLSVRSGPLGPFLALLAGVVLGRLFKYMQERGRPQAEALQAVNRLQALVRTAHPDDQKILAPMVEAVRKLVYRQKLETVTATLEAIEARSQVLNELRAIETALKDKEQHPKVKEALEKIAQARRHLELKQDAEATALLEEIKRVLVSLKTTMMGVDGRPDADVARAAERAEVAEGAADRAARGPLVPAEPRWLERLKDWLVILSGLSDQIRAEATLWLVRPLLYMALMIGLLAVGISSLYVENGAAFGANPFADYLGLLLWGLSADVAGRSLANLRGGGAD
ncbi:MAG: hypothetical protein NUW24_04700 [Anaerolineae bacterium]|jgi:hypothetical protein|nr:hypothetical protein [Anaerolineae bacterium]MDH7473941.1 hypothetical protein [Anaerolineae bacterium]